MMDECFHHPWMMLPVRQHLLDVVGLFWIGGLGSRTRRHSRGIFKIKPHDVQRENRCLSPYMPSRHHRRKPASSTVGTSEILASDIPTNAFSRPRRIL